MKDFVLFDKQKMSINGKGGNLKENLVQRETEMNLSPGGRSSTYQSPQEDSLEGLTHVEAEERIARYGYNEIPEKKFPLWWIYVKQYMGAMPIMIMLAAILAAAVQQWPDFGIIMAVLLINTTLGFYEEIKAQTSLDSLKGGLVTKVGVKRQGEVNLIESRFIVPGDIIFLRAGMVVPADATFIEGDTMQVDTSALTGEPFPRKVPNPDAPNGRELLSGCIIKQGEGYCRVEKTGLDTEIGTAAKLIQEAGEGEAMGVFESKILGVVKCIIGGTLLIVVIMLILQLRPGGTYNPKNGKMQVPPALISAMALVIASVPIALPVVIQVCMAVGAKTMADKEAIVTHLTALQEIASMDCLCSDKTGTLTTAEISVLPEMVWTRADFEVDHVMMYALLTSNRDNKEDPIDAAVIRSCDEYFAKKSIQIESEYECTKLVGFNPIVKRTVAYVKGPNNLKLRISKGLVSKVLKTDEDDEGIQWCCQGYEDIKDQVNREDVKMSKQGYKTIGIAVAVNDEEMHFVGILPMLDPPRHDTAETIANIRSNGINVKMITGDHTNIARETARLIGLGANILPATELGSPSESRDQLIERCHGFAQVLPKDKQEVVSVIQKRGHVVGMTGDGVNDAPALAQAQIGIAVHGATDAAKSAADIILTSPGLSAIFTGVVESRKIFKRLRTYVVYRLAATIQIVLFLVFVILIMQEQFQAIYILLLSLLNDISQVAIAYDIAIPSLSPETPTIADLLVVSSTLGLFEAFQGIIFYLTAQSWLTGLPNGCNDNTDKCIDLSAKSDISNYPTYIATCSENCCTGVGCIVDAQGTSYAGFYSQYYQQYLQSAVYLQISVGIEILIFSVRTPGFWFLSRPGTPVICSILFAIAVISCLGSTGVLIGPLKPLGVLTGQDVFAIYLYDFVWLYIMDVIKFFANWLMKSNNLKASLGKSALVHDPTAPTQEDLVRASLSLPRQSKLRLSSRLSNVNDTSFSGDGSRVSVSSFSRKSLGPNTPANLVQRVSSVRMSNLN